MEEQEIQNFVSSRFTVDGKLISLEDDILSGLIIQNKFSEIGLTPTIPKDKKKLDEFKKKNGFEYQSFIDSADLSIKNIEPISFICENVLMKSGITIFGGDSGVGKSILSQYLAIVLSRQISFLGHDCKKARVLYVDQENREITIKERHNKICSGLAINPNDIRTQLFYAFSNFMLDTKFSDVHPDIKSFKFLLGEIKPDVVVLDSLVRFFSGDENDVKDMRQIFNVLKSCIDEFGCSFLILHHTTKTPSGKKHDLRGSGDLSAMADLIFILSKTSQHITFNQVKNRHAQEIPTSMFRICGNTEQMNIVYDGIKKNPETENERCQKSIIETMKEGGQWKLAVLQKKLLGMFPIKTIEHSFYQLRDSNVIIQGSEKWCYILSNMATPTYILEYI